MNEFNEEKYNDIKNNIVKRAILLGWIVTMCENDTIVIKKNKIHMNNFEKNTELLLTFLTNNNEFNTKIKKNI